MEENNKPKILYVDDEENNLLVFKSSFRRYYDIYVSKSGAEGIEILKEHDIAVIITDQRMPGMTGVEFLKQLPSELLAIRMVLTGFTDVAAIIDAINSGKVYRYITKPWDKDELKITIDNALEALSLRKNNQELIQELKETNEQLEGKVIERTRELEEALAAINAQKYELEELNATKDKFFSIVAHDLRTPVSSLAGFSSMLSKYGDQMSPEEISKFSKDLHKSVKNALSLVENLLTWARTQMDKMEHSPSVVNINTVVKETVEQMSSSAGSKNIRLQENIAANLQVFADENHLRLILRNLVTNAIKFTPEGGSITISTSQAAEGQAEITVEDTGVGMGENRLSRLFKIGEANSTNGTAGEKGTGLGLVLCKEFVEKNSGSIAVRSTEGSGTTFTIQLPQNQEQQSLL
jgi:two-component system sensor histidine kinase/response regulator